MLHQPAESKVVTTGKDLIDYIVSNELYDTFVGVGCEGYTCDASDDEIVMGYDGGILRLFDSCYYEGYCD